MIESEYIKGIDKMADHKAVEVDQEELKNAQEMWHNFTVIGKYSTIATCVILIGLALAFVKLF